MKPFRLLVVVVATGALVLVAVVSVAFNARFQTWAARKALAARTDMRVTLGSVDAGLGRVQVKDLRIERDGATLVIPSLEIDVPVVAAGWRKEVRVERLTAKGWTLDLSTAPAPASAGAGSTTASTPAAPGAPSAPIPLPAASPASTVGRGFAGIFGLLELPVDVRVDGLDLNGEVVLPHARGRVKVSVKGGGLRAGQEGNFELVADATLADAEVARVEVQGRLSAAMDTPRRFSRVAATLNAAAAGTKFPTGVKLVANVAAARAAEGETYRASVTTQEQEIFNLEAQLPPTADKLTGTWKVDVREADVAPFVLGQPLPKFAATGKGTFDAVIATAAVRAAGRLNATAGRLEVIAPELAVLGELKISSDFDLAHRAGTIAVQKLEAAISAAEPVLTVRSLQAFEFNPRTGHLQAAEVARDLFGVILHAAPVAWARPFVTGLEIGGGSVRGEFVGRARGGGMTLRTSAPLTVDRVTVAQIGKLLVKDVDISVGLSADYTPQGWQAELTDLTGKVGDASLFNVDAKAGQLAGPGQPLKTTGRLTANLPPLLAQPVAVGTVSLQSGGAVVDFSASFGTKQEIQATLALENLSTMSEKVAVKLPAVTATLRADVASDGRIAFSAPIVLQRDDRKSDVTMVGTLGPEQDKVRSVDGTITSTLLLIDDARLFAALSPPPSAKPPKPADAAAPWAGWHGAISLQLKRLVYTDSFEITNLGGRLQIDAGTVKLEAAQARVGEAGRASAQGIVTFEAKSKPALTLMADVALREFDPGPLLQAVDRDQPPTVEGRFDLTTKLVSRAGTLGDLASVAAGDLHLTSKGGTFRGLPVNVGHLVENSSKIGGWIASAGTAIGSMTGKKEYADVANKVQAVGELAKGLYPIHYDQLSVILTRDAGLNTAVKNFVLIAPEIRLTGSGTALHRPGSNLLDDALAMEFRLRARGRQGDLLKYLGVLDAHPDDLGYAACTLPLRIGGTLGKPDTSELNSTLAALALEKSGVTEKASELFNRVFGGGK